MKHSSSLAEPIERHDPVVLAAGFFDGLHLGHQCLLEETLQSANAVGGQGWVLTFDQHPLRVLRPEAAPARILSGLNQRAGFQQVGLHGALVLPFTPDLATWTADEFVSHLQEGFPTLQKIVVGADWRFGHQAEGDVALLKQLGRQRGFKVHIIEPVMWNGDRVSSSRIRKALIAGQMSDAAAMLGRPYQLIGRVIHGRKTGREQGYPTANLEPENDLVPPSGIYAVSLMLEGQKVLAAGYRADGPSKVFEVYLMDYNADLYGQTLTINVHERIRESTEFASKKALLDQIGRDVEQIQHSWGSIVCG